MRARAIASLTLVGTLAIGLLIAFSTGVEAKNKAEFLPAFEAAYPEAVGTRIDSCSLCHFTNSEGKWDENAFAEEFEEADKSFIAIQNLDTDGDGFTNLQEIQAGTFPGVASDNPNTVVTTTTVPGAAGSGEAIYQSNCASCHGGNGGNLVPTSSNLSQLSNTITNGTPGMPGFSNKLTSGEIQLVAEYLLNWSGAPTTTTTTIPGFVPDGAAVWSGSCAGCHGSNGGNLADRGLSASRVASVTASGTSGMPGFSSSLSTAQIDAVAAYVASLAPPPTTTTAPGSPPPSGATVWAGSCAGCHGSNGGNLLGRGLSASTVASVTTGGTSGMPGFSSSLSTAQIDAVAAYVASLAGAAPTTTTTAPGSPPPSGAAVFAESCAACHGAGGGNLVGHSLTSSQLRTVTVDGQGSMAGFGSRLSSAQIDAVVAYLASIGETTLSSDSTDIDGAALYTTHCSACHGAHAQGGSGGPLAGTDLAQSELIWVTTAGRGDMPAFVERLAPDEVAAIADFVLSVNPLPDQTNEVAETDDGDTDDDSGDGLSLFLDEDSSADPAKSPLIVGFLILGSMAIVGGVGTLWLKSARELVQ